MKYILIWYFHDTNVDIYDTEEELLKRLEVLEEDYGNSYDFKYEIYEGKKKRKNEGTVSKED